MSMEANLLVLNEQSNIFNHLEPPKTPMEGSPQAIRQPWMRMALLKNDDSTYQAILIERGRLICETHACLTPYSAAIALFDWTCAKVGEALTEARHKLREGQAEDETVLKREPSAESHQTTQTMQSFELETLMEQTTPAMHRGGLPWGKNLTRLGSMNRVTNGPVPRRESFPKRFCEHFT